MPQQTHMKCKTAIKSRAYLLIPALGLGLEITGSTRDHSRLLKESSIKGDHLPPFTTSKGQSPGLLHGLAQQSIAACKLQCFLKGRTQCDITVMQLLDHYHCFNTQDACRYVFGSLSLQPPDQNLPKFPNHSILYIMYGDPVLNSQIKSAIIFAMLIRGQHQILLY